MEAIAAPDYEPEALEILKGKKNLRLMKVAAGLDEPVLKSPNGARSSSPGKWPST